MAVQKCLSGFLTTFKLLVATVFATVVMVMASAAILVGLLAGRAFGMVIRTPFAGHGADHECSQGKGGEKGPHGNSFKGGCVILRPNALRVNGEP